MRRQLIGLTCAAVSAMVALTACTDDPHPTTSAPPVTAPALQLVSFDSCDKLLADVRAAAKASVQPWGFGNQMWMTFGGAEARGGAVPKSDAAGAGAPAYSGTNTHEAGVDEPDLVKTDGQRIVTVTGNQLRVVDAARHAVAGTLALTAPAEQMLLAGDHALVFGIEAMMYEGAARAKPFAPMGQTTTVWLVDLAGAPRIISTYTIDGTLADARQTGSVARVVVRSTPGIQFPTDVRGDRKSLIKANQKIIDTAPLEAWLPEYASDGEKGRVDCGDVRRPTSFSGASLVTVLSFDIARARLADGMPSAVFADAETVYGSGPHLYLAHDERWRGTGTAGRTDLYMFDITGAKPRYVAAGSVKGYLLSQYALSEHDGVLRVATTTGHPWQQNTKSTSSVYALRLNGGELSIAGSVGGLGKGEQIYAVRFVGTIGYVVTFRRTDPLYTIDLHDPAHLVVAGQLKVPGYSAYLHPVGQDRLLGVGQAADGNGRVQGTQISLFDVSDVAEPRRLANHAIGEAGYSEAEFDPHAFLYWPAARLLVVPVQKYSANQTSSGALLIRVGDHELTELGWISQPIKPTSDYYPSPIRRSLVIGEELWTVSPSGVMASSLDGKRQIAWLPA